MLLACSSCHRQYDVGAFEPGERIRCQCGELCVVPRPRSRQAPMLHCSSCGGQLREGRRQCEYCSAEIRLTDRGLGPACPECFATTFAGARHCSACGVRLDPQSVLRALSSHSCPRCKRELSECTTVEARYVECLVCGGLWLSEELFQRVVDKHDSALAMAFLARGPSALPAGTEPPLRYLPCPVCGQLMNRRNFASASGVILDWCRGHGWWFDAQELERVLEFIRSGGLERARRRTHEERRLELERLKRRAEAARSSAGELHLERLGAERGLGNLLADFLLRFLG